MNDIFKVFFLYSRILRIQLKIYRPRAGRLPSFTTTTWDTANYPATFGWGGASSRCKTAARSAMCSVGFIPMPLGCSAEAEESGQTQKSSANFPVHFTLLLTLVQLWNSILPETFASRWLVLVPCAWLGIWLNNQPYSDSLNRQSACANGDALSFAECWAAKQLGFCSANLWLTQCEASCGNECECCYY